MNKIRTGRMQFLINAGGMLSVILYIFIRMVDLAAGAERIFHVSINNHARFNSLIVKYSSILLLSYFLILFYINLKKYGVTNKLKNFGMAILKYTDKLFSFKNLFLITIIYLILLFYFGVKYYDLGFDEAWYLEYARNFFSYLFPFSAVGDNPMFFDTFQMLPMYIFSVINFMVGLTDVWHFKLLSSVLSAASIIIIARLVFKIYNFNVTAIFLFLLCIQPGFGFVASSFFGEIVQAAFFFLAIYLWFKSERTPNPKGIWLISFLFAVAIHTKFQLLWVILLSLLSFHFVDKEKKALRIAIQTFAIVVLIAFIRFLPILVYDKSLVISYLKQSYFQYGASLTQFNIENYLDRLQLLNRFYPIVFLSVVLIFMYFQVKTSLERFVLIFMTYFVVWWIFAFQYSTYRHLFMGLIALSFLSSIFINNLYNIYSGNKSDFKIQKYISNVAILLVMLYGFSTNIIYAYIGYNDGVQFDLDGFRSRLFSNITHDISQKDFYNEITNYISPQDTLYGGTFVTKFYLKNTVLDYPSLPATENSSSNKFILITREKFPLGLNKGYAMLDSLSLKRELILKKGEYELYNVHR